MTVKLDSGKTAEVSAAKARHIDYGYAVDGLKSTRAERVIATGNGPRNRISHRTRQKPAPS